MSTRVYIDASNIFHMCFSIANSTMPQWIGRYKILDVFLRNLEGKLNTISRLIWDSGIDDAEFVFVKDECSVRKIILYPDYKANRNTSEIPIRAALDFVKERSYGKVCCSPQNEADDAIATLIKETGGVVISADKDLWQLMDFERTFVLNPITKEFTTKENIYKVYKLENPCQIALYKALWGDSGDGVPNIMPYKQKQLLPIVRESDGTVEDFKNRVESYWSMLTPHCRQLYHKNEEQLTINWQLVKLDTECQIIWE